MGWTHNWQRPSELPADAFAAAAGDCARIAEVLSCNLAGSDGTGEPVFGSDLIEFNGPQPDCCEPFRFAVHEIDRRGRELVCSFCKTQRMPYDLAVQCALIILKHHLGELIDVGSDGSEDDWRTAQAFVTEHLGWGSDFALSGPK